MMFLLTRDKKLTKSQLSPTHASTERKITDELKHNAGWYEVREGSPVEVQYKLYFVNYYISCLLSTCQDPMAKVSNCHHGTVPTHTAASSQN